MNTSLQDLFTSLDPQNYRVEEPKVKTIPCDVLALSCCAYRKRDEQHPFLCFQSIDPNDITEEDISLAEAVRKYYGKKYLWISLHNRNLTEFQQTVLNFLTQDNRQQFLETQEGMIHKLPEFYANDQITDAIFKNADTSDLDNTRIPPVLRTKQTKKLHPVDVVEIRNKRSKENKYWLKDDSNRLYLLSIPLPNTLEHMWVDLFNNSSTIKINGHYLPQRSMNGDYYKIVDWKLEK